MCVFSTKETYDPLEKAIKPAEMYWFILCHGKNIGSGYIILQVLEQN
jgi:hypothetical protein